MVAHFHEISPDLISEAHLVIAIDPANPTEETEIYCEPDMNGEKSVLRAVRVVIALLDWDQSTAQIEALRRLVREARG